jgi:hypothetical protein
VQVALSGDGVLKYLGRNLDMHLSGDVELADVMQYCANALTYVCKRRSSAETKMLAIKLCIIPKVVYKLKFIAWPLSNFDKLERIFAASFRKLTKNIRSFPTQLLYVSVRNGGLGCPSIVDAIHKAKLSLAMRGLGMADTHHSMSGLLARGIAYTGCPVRVNIRASAVGDQWTDDCWARSLIEWAKRAGIRLVAEGVKPSGDEQTLQEWNDRRGQLISKNVFEETQRNGELTLNDGYLDDVEVAEVFLRVGQCWSTTDQLRQGCVCEILVVNEAMVDYITWWSMGCLIESGTCIKLNQEQFTLGAGARVSHAEPHLAFVQRLNGSVSFQVFMSGDRHSRAGEVHNAATVLRVMRRVLLPPCEIVIRESSVWDTAAVVGVGKGCERPWSIERGAVDLPTSVGVLVVQEKGKLVGHQLVGVHLSSEQVEQMATIMACFGLADHSVYPLTKKWENELWRVQNRMGMKATSHWNMLSVTGLNMGILANQSGGKANNVPEDLLYKEVKKPQKTGTLADGDAYKNVNFQDEIRGHLEFSWEDARGRLIYNLEQEVDSIRTMTYCIQRDKYRAAEGRQPRWAGVPSQLASDMWGMSASSMGQRARTVRILWDKHWTGENQAKAGFATPAICKVCGVVTGQRHLVEACVSPCIVRIRTEGRQNFDRARLQLPAEGKEACVLGLLADMLRQVEAYSIWTGMWTALVRRRFARMNGHGLELNTNEYKTVVKVLHILAEAVNAMVSVEQVAEDIVTMEVADTTRRKRSIGGQRTLEEFGFGNTKRSHVEVTVLEEQQLRAEATAALEVRMLRHRVRSIREDDSSQFDVG